MRSPLPEVLKVDSGATAGYSFTLENRSDRDVLIGDLLPAWGLKTPVGVSVWFDEYRFKPLLGALGTEPVRVFAGSVHNFVLRISGMKIEHGEQVLDIRMNTNLENRNASIGTIRISVSGAVTDEAARQAALAKLSAEVTAGVAEQERLKQEALARMSAEVTAGEQARRAALLAQAEAQARAQAEQQAREERAQREAQARRDAEAVAAFEAAQRLVSLPPGAVPEVTLPPILPLQDKTVEDLLSDIQGLVAQGIDLLTIPGEDIGLGAGKKVFLPGGGFIAGTVKAGATQAVAAAAEKQLLKNVLLSIKVPDELAAGIIAMGAKRPADLTKIIKEVTEQELDEILRIVSKAKLAFPAEQTLVKFSLDAAQKKLTFKSIALVVGGLFTGIFALTAIPQLFLMTTFARTEVPQNVQFGVKAIEDPIGSGFFSLDKALKAGDAETAERLAGEIEKGINEYEKFITSGTYAGFDVRHELENAGTLDIHFQAIEILRAQLTEAKNRIAKPPEPTPTEKKVAAIAAGKATVTYEAINAEDRKHMQVDWYLNGKLADTDTWNLNLEGDKGEVITVEARSGGFTPSVDTYTLAAGLNPTQTLELRREPGAAPAGLPARGTVNITTVPRQAKIYLDNEYTFQFTDTLLAVDAGKHRVTLKLEGYEDYAQDVEVADGQSTSISRNMVKIPVPAEEEKPLPQLGFLTVDANVPSTIYEFGAVVIIQTPGTVELQQGFHDIIAKSPDHENAKKTVQVLSGKTTVTKLELLAKVPEEIKAGETVTGAPHYKISVRSTPEGAKVLINGEFSGEWTPAIIRLLPGNYTMSLVKSGFNEFFIPLELEAL